MGPPSSAANVTSPCGADNGVFRSGETRRAVLLCRSDACHFSLPCALLQCVKPDFRYSYPEGPFHGDGQRRNIVVGRALRGVISNPLAGSEGFNKSRALMDRRPGRFLRSCGHVRRSAGQHRYGGLFWKARSDISGSRCAAARRARRIKSTTSLAWLRDPRRSPSREPAQRPQSFPPPVQPHPHGQARPARCIVLFSTRQCVSDVHHRRRSPVA